MSKVFLKPCSAQLQSEARSFLIGTAGEVSWCPIWSSALPSPGRILALRRQKRSTEGKIWTLLPIEFCRPFEAAEIRSIAVEGRTTCSGSTVFCAGTSQLGQISLTFVGLSEAGAESAMTRSRPISSSWSCSPVPQVWVHGRTFVWAVRAAELLSRRSTVYGVVVDADSGSAYGLSRWRRLARGVVLWCRCGVYRVCASVLLCRG